MKRCGTQLVRSLVVVGLCALMLVGVVGNSEAALEYVGGNSGSGTNNDYSVSLTGLSGGIGTSAATGDLVIVVTGFAGTANGNPGVVTPNDYVEIADLWADDARDANVSVNWKIMGATPDTAITVTGSGNTANGASTVVHVWRGADLTTPMDVTRTTATDINETYVNSPSITPVTTGAVVLSVGGGTRAGNNTATFVAPTNYINAISQPGPAGTISFHTDVASRAWTSGAEDPVAWSGGNTWTDDSWGAVSVAIRPNICDATAVTDLTASNPTGSSIDLSWSGGAGTTSFDLYRSTTAGVDTSGVALATGITSTYTDSDTLSALTTYYYKLKQSGTACTVDSNETSATTLATSPQTTVGAMSFSNVSSSSITVQVGFSGDDSGAANNNATVRYRIGAGAWSSPTAMTRSVSAFTANVGGLSDSTNYEFEVTVTDPNNVTNSGTTTYIFSAFATTTANFTNHNSMSTYSTKHSGSGGWGVGGGVYGAFTCQTCHSGSKTDTGTNIKRLRTAINQPATTLNNRPVGTTANAATDYGDDSSAATAKICETCHGLTNGATQGTKVYQAGWTQTNWTLQHPFYTDAGQPQYKDCNFCHKHKKGFKVNGGCLDCHDSFSTKYPTTSPVAPKVVNSSTDVGSHMKILSADSFTGFTTDNWNTQCLKCHDGHKGPLMIPNNAAVGINYATTGGIQLGGAATSGSTEAEICWNCHDANSVSEWNAITDHGLTVTGGSNWTATSFALDSTVIPNRAVISMHSGDSSLPASTASSVQANIDWANGNVIASNAASTISVTLENVSSIRCSYCHDVHDLNQAANDATTGAPYLRGSWLHNPYMATAIERPPQSGDSWTGQAWSHFDAGDTVPRLRTDLASKNAVGGYQIDQNNGYPTSSYLNATTPANELTNTAGLCVLCHGNNPRLYDAYADVSDTRTLWLSGNGHANASLGGDLTGAINLFDARNRDNQLDTTTEFYMAGQGVDLTNIDQWGQRETRRNKLPYGWNADAQRVDNGNSASPTRTPPKYTGYYTAINTAGNNRNTDTDPLDYANWYSEAGIGDARTVSNRAHDFSCSKCHTPHASGLPALLVTNCLDYTISDWSVTSNNGGTSTGAITLGPLATDRWALEAMNNCHRKKNTTTGWNKLAPAQ